MFCGFIFFLNGLDVVFFYIIDGGFCVDVIISGVDVGMGVFILDGLFFDFVIECVGVGGSGSVFGINFELFGIYYIIVVNGMGCMEFDFFIMEVECNLQFFLFNVFCNLFNGCIFLDNFFFVFIFN